MSAAASGEISLHKCAERNYLSTFIFLGMEGLSPSPLALNAEIHTCRNCSAAPVFWLQLAVPHVVGGGGWGSFNILKIASGHWT
jgi:hypothetical protein